MYKIAQEDYGFRLAFSDYIQSDEMEKWLEESIEKLANAPVDFNVFVDMRSLKPLPLDSQRFIQKGQKLFKEKGMKRSVAILSSPVTQRQFQRISSQTGISKSERYINTTFEQNWEQAGMDWLIKGIDPEN